MLEQLRRRSLAVVSALIVVGATAFAVTTAGASSGRSGEATPTSPERAISPRLGQIFNVLGASATADAPPLPAATSEAVSVSASRGTIASAARFAGGSYPAWVVPGSEGVCLVVGASGRLDLPSAVCGTITEAEERGLALTATAAAGGSPIVVGLAPNGNTSVTVTNADGAREEVPVANNVYEVTAGRPSTVTLKDAAGAQVTRRVG